MPAEFIKQDALSLPAESLGKYDISMSLGLTEHFKGSKRININKIHFDILRKGGIGLIFVPYKYSLPCKMYKFAARTMGIWGAGEEESVLKRGA